MRNRSPQRLSHSIDRLRADVQSGGMVADSEGNHRAYLNSPERWAAGIFGAVLLGAAAWAIMDPPARVVALTSCTPSKAASCTVSTDGDLSAFASAIAAFGVAALLVALLGVRFSKVSAAGVSMEGKFDDVAAGMEQVPAPAAGDSGTAEGAEATAQPAESVKDDVSEESVPRSFKDLSGTDLNRLRRQVYDNQRGIFLAHVLGTPKSPRQAYRVAIFVVGHKRPITPEAVEGATIFLGEAWGSQKFEASWSNEGRLGVVVEAFGPFLAVGEVRLTTGERVVARHYVEFAQAEVLS